MYVLKLRIHLCVSNTLDIDDGLSLSSVYCVFRDSKGYMWFATEDGVNRYDGYHFQVFRSEANNPNSICHKWVESIIEDSSGCLWLGSAHGLSRYNPQKELFTNFTTIDPSFQIVNDTILRLEVYNDFVLAGTAKGLSVIDINNLQTKSYTQTGWVNSINIIENTIWIASKNGLFTLDTRNNQLQMQLKGIVNDLTFDKKEIWAAGENSLWHKEDGNEKWLQYVFNEDNAIARIENIVTAEKNNIWIGADDGLYKFQANINYLEKVVTASEKSKSLSVNQNKCLIKDESSNIWYGTHGNGLFIIKDGNVSQYTNNPLDPSSLSQNQINCIYQDPVNQNIWLGTYGAGLNIYNSSSNKFEILKHNPLQKNSLSSNFIWTICEAHDGWIWIGTNDKGITCYHPQKDQYRYFDVDDEYHSLPNTSVRDIYEDRSGTIWLGTDGGGLCRHDEQGFTVFAHDDDDPNSISDNSVRVIFEDKHNRLWVGTKKGLNLFDRETNTARRFMHNPNDSTSISNNFVYSTIMEDSKGRLWLGTYGGGLNMLDPETLSFTHYTTQTTVSISNDIVFSIYEDNAGLLWIGTNQGLNCLNPTTKEVTFYGTSDGLPNEVIYGILPDEKGCLWLSTNYGICCFDIQTGETTNFDINDGLQSNEFNGGAFHQGRDGKLYFGGVYGLNIIDPNKSNFLGKTNKTVFTRLDVMGSRVQTNANLSKSGLLYRDEKDQLWLDHHISYLKSFTLPYAERFFSLEFSGMNHMFSDKTQYQFQLWPLDKEWNNAGTRNFVSYANINPGDYTFRVRSSGSDGKWGDQVAELSIIVQPPLWLKGWFIIIEILFLLMIVIFIYQYLLRQRTNKLLKQQNSAIKQANERLKESENYLLSLNATKDKFFSIISHDLKNPFTSLMSISDILHDNYNVYDDEDRKECVGKMHHSIKQIYSLLENLLTWSRSQRGKISYVPQSFDVSSMILENINLYRIAAQKKNIQIQFKEDNVQHRAYGDRNSINTVIRNLMGNAIKFTDDGGMIRIMTECNQHHLRILIKDNGMGMSEESCDKLFKIDQKLKKEGTHGEKGTGLGLIICKEFVEKNGGKIGVLSELGKGSEFWFTVPVNKVFEE